MSDCNKRAKSIGFGTGKWWKWHIYTLLALTLFLSLSRSVFIFINIELTEYSIADLLLTFYHGFRLDLSMAAYLTTALTLLSPLRSGNCLLFAVYRSIYALIVILLIIIILADAILYTYWGFKLDSSILKYLKTPGEAIASLAISELASYTSIVSLIVLSVVLFVKRYVLPIKLTFKRLWQINGILLLPLLFLISRGSIDVSGVNVSTAYFSQKTVLNHAAVNPTWHFMSTLLFPESIINIEGNDTPTYSLEQFETLCDSVEQVIDTDSTNIIIIVLESFTANLLDYAKENQSPVPNLKRIAGEGYFFPNCYATGNRSDKGLSSIFSGITAHPKGSIMQYPEKFTKIGKTAAHFLDRGYQTRFYYGGNPDFANFKGFLINNGFEHIVGKSDFPHHQRTSKWGVHDNIVFDRFYSDINSTERPFFFALFTLSSHEPFDVPHNSIFSDETEVGKYLNSISFTDSLLGVFYDRLASSELWNNTLLIIVADHGHILPFNIPHNQPGHYRIPLIFAGGALKQQYRGKTTVYNVSQADIPHSILWQFNIRDSLLGSNNNIFCTEYKQPIGFVFNFGYGIITQESDTVVYDADGQIFIRQTTQDSTLLKNCNAWFRNKMKIYSKQ